MSCPRTQHNVPDQGGVSGKPRKLFGPVKALQNLEPYDYRAVLLTYSKDEERFPSYKKFQEFIQDFIYDICILYIYIYISFFFSFL